MSIFVSGASGQLGRRVVALLVQEGVSVVAGTRSPEKLEGVLGEGVEVRAFDFHDPEGMVKSLAGVTRALLISSDAVGSRLAPQKAAVQAAKEAGVGHLVYTSVTNADVEGMAVSEEHIGTEKAIQEAFDSYTILRNNLYAELVFGALEAAKQTGQLVTARGDGRVAWVSREDCARAAAAALSDSFSGPRTLDITGPASLSGDEMAGLFQELLGSPVVHHSVSVEALVEGMVTNAGMPRPVAELFAAFDRSASEGLLGRVSGDLLALTGKEGASLREVLSR